MPNKKPANPAVAKKPAPTSGAMVAATIKHVTRRAGIRNVHGACHQMLKDLYSHIFYNVLADSVVLMSHMRRKTLTLAMLNRALKTNKLNIVLTPDSHSKRKLAVAKKALRTNKNPASPSAGSDTADEQDDPSK